MPKRTLIAQAIATALPIIPSEPGILDMKTAFAPIDAMIESLYRGEIDFEGSTPVMADWDGWCELAPALHGWCDCWERIASHMGQPLPDLAFIRRLVNRLSAGMLIDVSDIDRAKTTINRCRALYFACPNWIRKAAVQDEMIAIALDELGLRRAA